MRKYFLKHCASGFVLLFLFCCAAFAQETKKLTLEECIQTALGQNVDIRMAGHEVKQSSASLSEVKSALYPQLQFSSSFSRTKTLTYSFSLQPVTTTGASSQGGGLTPSASAASATATSLTSTLVKSDLLVNSFRYGMSISQLVYDFGKTLSLIKAQKAQAAAQAAELENTKIEIIYAVKKAYAELLRAKSFQRIQEAMLLQAQEQLKFVQSQYKLGLVLKTDVLSSDVSVTEMQKTLLQAQDGVELAKIQLNSVMSRDLDAPVDVVENLLFDTDAVCVYDECMKLALEKRSEVARAFALKNASGYQMLNAKKKKFPNITATTNLEYKDDTFPPERFNWTVGMGLDFPVYDGGRITSGIMRTREQLALSALSIEKLKSAIALEVKQAYLSYEEAKKKVSLSEQLVSQTQENLKNMEGRQKQGAALPLEVLQAKTKSIQSREQLIQATIDLFLSVAQIDKVTAGTGGF